MGTPASPPPGASGSAGRAGSCLFWGGSGARWRLLRDGGRPHLPPSAFSRGGVGGWVVPGGGMASKGGTHRPPQPPQPRGRSRGLLSRHSGGPRKGSSRSPHRAARNEGLRPRCRREFLGKGVRRAGTAGQPLFPHPAGAAGRWLSLSRRPGLVRVREEPTNPSDGSWEPSQPPPSSPHPPRAPPGLGRGLRSLPWTLSLGLEVPCWPRAGWARCGSTATTARGQIRARLSAREKPQRLSRCGAMLVAHGTVPWGGARAGIIALAPRALPAGSLLDPGTGSCACVPPPVALRASCSRAGDSPEPPGDFWAAGRGDSQTQRPLGKWVTLAGTPVLSFGCHPGALGYRCR